MRRATQAVVRRDPNTRTWWWVCVEPTCSAQESIGLGLVDQPAALRAADAHLRTVDHRAPLVTSASERGTAGGGR